MHRWRRWFKDHPLTTTLLALAFAAGPAFYRSEQIDDARASDIAAENVARCHGFNEQQARSRSGERAQIRALIDPDEPLTPEEQAMIDETLRRHDAQIDQSYPDRDCSPEGIAAYLNRDP